MTHWAAGAGPVPGRAPAGQFSSLIPAAHWERFESRLKRSTGAVSQMLADTGQSATFFTCGWIADHHADVLREVVAAGHEVACQGYFQHGVHDMPPAAFLEDLRRSKAAVEHATGRAVHGHRISRRWLREADLWALESVREAGFAYDASVYPQGRAFAQLPQSQVVARHMLKAGTLIEVPVSSFAVGPWRLPIAGGNWLRQAPDGPLRRAAANWQRTRAEPLVACFHTWEFDAEQPRIAGASWLQRKRHYRNLAPMPARLRAWLHAHCFTSAAAHLGLDVDLRADSKTPAAAPPPRAEPTTVQPIVGPGVLPARPLTLVIPCFNEEPTLPYLARTLRRFAAHDGAGLALSYVFIDDGSSDQTWALMRQHFAELPRCTLRRHPVNRGIAAALLTGFAACETELVAVIDADCTFDPAQLPAMLAVMEDGVDVVSASPAHAAGAMKNVPPWRRALSLGSALLYRRVLRHRLTSYTSCFRVYRRQALQALVLSEAGFCGVAEILGRLDLAGHHIVEYPAVLETRVLGASKIRVLRTVGEHLRLLARLAAARWLGRPLPARVFGPARRCVHELPHRRAAAAHHRDRDVDLGRPCRLRWPAPGLPAALRAGRGRGVCQERRRAAGRIHRRVEGDVPGPVARTDRRVPHRPCTPCAGGADAALQPRYTATGHQRAGAVDRQRFADRQRCARRRCHCTRRRSTRCTSSGHRHPRRPAEAR